MLSLGSWFSRLAAGRRRPSELMNSYRPGLEELAWGSSGRRACTSFSCRPRVEQLEERCLPSFATGVLSAVNASTGGTVFYLKPDQNGQGNDIYAQASHALGTEFKLSANGLVATMSAGLGPNNDPVVFALSTSGDVWENQPLRNGWVRLGGGAAGVVQFKAISGGVNDVCGALDVSGNVWIISPAGAIQLTTGGGAQQISVGHLGARNIVFGLLNNDVYANQYLQSGKWFQLSTGGVVSAIRGGENIASSNIVTAISMDRNVYCYDLVQLGWIQVWTGHNAANVCVDETQVYITDNSNDLSVVSPSDPANPTPISQSGNVAFQSVGAIAAENGQVYFISSAAHQSNVPPDDLYLMLSPFGHNNGGSLRMLQGSQILDSALIAEY